MRAGGQFNRAADVVDAVGGGKSVVLGCLENVSVDAALKDAGVGDAFAVEFDGGVRTQGLKVDPIGARARNRQRAFPCDSGVRLERIATLGREVDGGINLFGAVAGAHQAGLSIVAEEISRNRSFRSCRCRLRTGSSGCR